MPACELCWCSVAICNRGCNLRAVLVGDADDALATLVVSDVVHDGV